MDFEPYLAARRERDARRRAEGKAASIRAMEIAKELARALVDRYGATRVVLVGSLARDEFRHDSDIDLAAAGLALDALFTAGAELERLAAGFKVDLIPLESANAFFLEQLSREGIVLS